MKPKTKTTYLLAQLGKLGTLKLKNRFVMPAVASNWMCQGHFTDQVVHNYGLRGKGAGGAHSDRGFCY